MVRARTWLIALPLLVLASEAGQWFLDRFVPESYQGADPFDHTRFGVSLLPLLLAVAFVAAAAGLVLDLRQPTSVAFPRRMFALLPPCVFVVQEHMEYVIGHGSRPWSVGLHWAFAVGLLIQVPLVLAAYWAAKLLIRFAHRVFKRGDAVSGEPRSISVPRLFELALSNRARPLRDARFNRGPPLPTS